jgi:hypothetical protein
MTTAKQELLDQTFEAALEKVRSVALSSKKSDELLHVAEALCHQLFELGFNNIRNVIIDSHIDDQGGFLDYYYSPDMGSSVTLMSYYDPLIIEKQVTEIHASTDGNEMIREIKEERKKNKENRDETLENELLEAISSSLEKINHHGKRADAIVINGMLQHSRSSSGSKKPTGKITGLGVSLTNDIVKGHGCRIASRNYRRRRPFSRRDRHHI